jgi:hypothetical protein
MGLANKNTNLINKREEFNEDELSFLLLLIKENTFKGENVELVYNTAYKLQQNLKSLKDS